MTITWTAASCGELDGCNSVVSYSYKAVNKSDATVIGPVTTTDLTVTISDLLPCTMYEFFVAATSDTGMTGPEGSAVSSQTSLIGKIVLKYLACHNLSDSAIPNYFSVFRVFPVFNLLCVFFYCKLLRG